MIQLATSLVQPLDAHRLRRAQLGQALAVVGSGDPHQQTYTFKQGDAVQVRQAFVGMQRYLYA